MSLASSNPLGTDDLGDRPSASCRLDWLSVSLFGATAARQREQLSYFFSLLSAVSDGATWSEPSPSKFFDKAVAHQAGISIKWTEPDSGKTNQGLISVDVRGTAFRALERETRKALYLDIAEMEGFKQCTRLDAQRTVLEPLMSAEDLHDQLLAGRYWVKGQRAFTQMGSLTGSGVSGDGSTVMWGSPQSVVRARSYNKSKESDWDVPAVRHEVQLRRQPARDKFNALIKELQVERDDQATTAENAFVQSVLNQHMAYLDTSRLAKLKRKDWPKNWAQRCENADWWDKEVVTGEPKEIKTIWRLQKKLNDSVAASDVQYGATLATWLLVEHMNTGVTPEEAFLVRSAQWVLRLKDKDLERAMQLVPEEKHEELLKTVEEWRAVAAHNAER